MNDMPGEIRISLTSIAIPRLIRPIVRCKICKHQATCCFVISGGVFVLLCEPCFQTLNVLYKREIRQIERVEGV